MSEPDEIEESLEEMEFTRKKALHAVVSFALVVALIGVLVVVVLVLQMTKPVAEKEERKQLVPAVEIVEVHQADRQLEIVSQGAVETMRDVMISAEVGGRVVWVSPSLLRGGAVGEGERLVEIDKRDHQAGLSRAEAGREAAKLQLDQEKARRDQAIRDWKKLGRGEPSELVLRKPHIDNALAQLASAEQEVLRAERNVERTDITAPFAGKVREESVEAGAVLSPGAMVARIYSTEELEVRVPLSLEDFGVLNWNEEGEVTGEVTLTGTIGSEEYEWAGAVVRMDGEIDRSTLSATAIVRVESCETHPAHLRLPPVGLFVEASVPAKVLSKVLEVPREALRGMDKVLVVDDEDRLHQVSVTILRHERETVLVQREEKDDGGLVLKDGDRVIVSRMSGVVDGMRVKVVDGLAEKVEEPE